MVHYTNAMFWGVMLLPLQALDGEAGDGDSAKSNLIGQFGVGFYSTFMVGHKVEVFSLTADSAASGVSVTCTR